MNTTAIKKISLATALCLAALASYSQTSSPASATSSTTNTVSTNPLDFSGTYKCSGFDPYNKASFSENITFTKTGDTYSVQLADSQSNGIPYMLGTALVNKDISNAISFVVWDPKKPETFGAGLYEIKPDGSLEGVWSTKGTNQVGTETCVKS